MENIETTTIETTTKEEKKVEESVVVPAEEEGAEIVASAEVEKKTDINAAPEEKDSDEATPELEEEKSAEVAPEPEKEPTEKVEPVKTEKYEREENTAIRLERNGEFNVENNRFEEAADDFRQALSHYRKINDHQSIGRMYFRLGFALEQQQRHNDAADNYKESKKIFLKMENLKDYAIVSDKLAKMHFFQGKIEEAEEEYKNSIELGCNNGEIFNNLGFIQIQAEQYEEAQKNLKEAVRLREQTDSTEIHLSYNNLGVIEYIQENYEAALQLFKKGVESDTRPAKEDRTIQFAVFMKPEFRGEKFSKIRSFEDVNTKACLILNQAAAEGMLGDINAALETASTALTLDKDRPYLYECAGWIYINRGEDKRAVDYFRRAVPYDPANEELRKIINMINPYINMKVGRNEPCPCGSGKKYKKCHGATV